MLLSLPHTTLKKNIYISKYTLDFVRMRNNWFFDISSYRYIILFCLDFFNMINIFPRNPLIASFINYIYLKSNTAESTSKKRMEFIYNYYNLHMLFKSDVSIIPVWLAINNSKKKKKKTRAIISVLKEIQYLKWLL